MSDKERLVQLLHAGHPCVLISTFEEEDALLMVRAASVEIGQNVWEWSINTGLRDALVAGGIPVDQTEHPAAALYHLNKHAGPCISILLDLASHLRDERTLRLLRELIQACSVRGGHVILIDHQDQFPPVIRALATPVDLSLPDEEELEQIVRSTLRRRNEQDRIRVELTRSELEQVVQALRGLTRRQARQVILDACSEDRRFDIADLAHMLARKRTALQGGGLLEYIETPVSLEEIGGLGKLKAWLEQRRCALGHDAELFGLESPRGILMLGVQGAGKSLSAKAVATAWRWPLLRMDVGALYDRYIGESERRLRESLHQAQRMAPVVLWIDEIEKAFASAASQSTDGGLSRRMFGTLLTWMQEHREPVFVIATANDVQALPPELLRKGRFDEIFFVDLPSTEAREQIFAIHLKKRKRDPGTFDLHALAQRSEGFSGAEIEQAVVSALHEAFAARSELTTQRIQHALETSPPLSVTMRERVAALRAWAQGRCVPAE